MTIVLIAIYVWAGATTISMLCAAEGRPEGIRDFFRSYLIWGVLWPIVPVLFAWRLIFEWRRQRRNPNWERTKYAPKENKS